MEFNENVIKGKIRRAEEKRGLLAGGAPADMRIVQGTGPANRHGMPKLPVGQREVPNWPVLDLAFSRISRLINGPCQSRAKLKILTH